MKWLKNNLNLLLSVALMLMTLTVFGPLELYLTNSAEFWFGFPEMLKIAGILTVVFGTILLLVGLVLKGKARSLYAALVFIVAFCLYIQGNFLNIDYGVLDGSAIDWSIYKKHAVVNTICWISMTVPLFMLWTNKVVLFERVSKIVSAFVVVVQILTLGVLLIGSDAFEEKESIRLSKDYMMEVGSEENIVIFVLDAFDDSLMDIFMETDSERYKSLFSDFTRFTDCTAGGAATAAGLPILITGEHFIDGLAYSEYINKAFNADGLYDALKERGYQVGIYTDSAYVGTAVGDYVSNYVSGEESPSSYSGLTAKYGSFVLFKYMPHILKQCFWLHTGEFDAYRSNESYIIDDAAFYNSLVTDKLVPVEKKSFRLFHLQGGHSPYTINEFAQPDEAATREQQAKGNLYIVEEYISQMKKCGVYDNAMIIITADHGSSEHLSEPIMFVKDKGASHPMEENDAPVSHFDLHATLYSYLGMEAGDTFFEVSDKQPRDRMFYLHIQDAGSFYMEEYLIQDKVVVTGNGVLTGNIFEPKKNRDPLTLGESLELGLEGNGNRFIVSGMDAWPINSVVSVGMESEFQFHFEREIHDDLNVEIEVQDLYDATINQSVQIYANGWLCYEEEVTGPQTIRFVVPADVVSGQTLDIKLVYATDMRPLFLSGITVDKVSSFSLTAIIAIPLIMLMQKCYDLLGDYILAIVVFTLLSKILLMPVALWMQRSSITMVEMMPELNQIKTKYFGDKETISEETQILYKKRKYNPLASTVPMIVQIVLLMGVIEAVKALLGDSDSWLLWIPAEVGGLSLLMPVAAGFAALLLTLAQNKLAPLQKEQPKAEQLSTGLVSVGISLFLGAFVSLGTGVYWIASNLFSIPVQVVCNWIINPQKYVDYEALEASKKQLEQFEAVGKKKKESYFSENKKRERADYKRFFSVVNKHLVFYSESNGFYKYYKGFIEFILAHTNLTIHYITSDPNDQIFELEKKQPKIRGYYIGENKLITLMMKMDADVVVMTMPDLENYHIKRSYIRDDIEYVNVSHGMGSNNLTFRKGALDHFDSVFCAGIHQKIEIEQQEAVYDLPAKTCVEVGYPLIDDMRENYAKTEHKTNLRKKILVAPSWQKENIIDSCLEQLLDSLKKTDCEIIVRPHPQEVRLKKEYMDSLKAKYEPDGIEIQTDFTSNNPVMEADLLITDWSDISWEYAFTTLRPVMYINTPMKVMNPEWQKIEYPPLNIALRDQLGKSLDVEQLDKAAETAEYLLANTDVYREKINSLAHEYVYNLGTSAEAGATYLIKAVLRQIQKKGTDKNES